MKLFINSNCFKEALNTNKNYSNIVILIEEDNIINKFLNNKYLKSIPLLEFSDQAIQIKIF